jgi:hypothetical protein
MVVGLILLAVVVLLGVAALSRYAGGRVSEAGTPSNVPPPPLTAPTPAMPIEAHGPWGGRKDEPSGPWN